jgi:hypothetical protein
MASFPLHTESQSHVLSDQVRLLTTQSCRKALTDHTVISRCRRQRYAAVYRVGARLIDDVSRSVRWQAFGLPRL